MAQQYRIFFLTAGQIAPENSTGIMLMNGGIVWYGEEGLFPTSAALGTHLDTDPEFSVSYDHRIATTEEVTEYETILNTP